MYKYSENTITSVNNNRRFVLQNLQSWTKALVFTFTVDDDHYDVIMILPARRQKLHTYKNQTLWLANPKLSLYQVTLHSSKQTSWFVLSNQFFWRCRPTRAMSS